MVFEGLTAGGTPLIFGDDYPTRDGTCVRDYIHVVDLADAHVAAARASTRPAGRGLQRRPRRGGDVLEMLAAMGRVTGVDFTPEASPRRPGDAPVYFADATKIDKELGWTARLDLTDMVRSAWEAWQSLQSAR